MTLFYLRSFSSSTAIIYHQLFRQQQHCKTHHPSSASSKLQKVRSLLPKHLLQIIMSSSSSAATTATIATTTTTTMNNDTSTRQQSSTLKSTPDLCDDYEDTIRIVDPTLGLRNYGGKNHFGGIISTVKIYEDNSLVKQLAKTNGSGKVMVVDGGGSRRKALLGDQVAADCANNGWEGLVIYGSIRDVDEISQIIPKLGVQALGTHPMKTIKRNEGQMNIPVEFGGVTFKPGEYIVCDNNGIVVMNETPMM